MFEINGLRHEPDVAERTAAACYRLICDEFDSSDSRSVRGFLSQSSGPLVGGARSAPAAYSAEAETPATGSEPTRSTLLGHTAECVAAMVRCPGHRETGDRNRVA